MNRRQFFGTMIGGVAATAATRTWPFRVFSFPAKIGIPKTTIRYIRAFDPAQSKMVCRWDMLYGFGVLDDRPGDFRSI